jgi:hypothetical protein
MKYRILTHPEKHAGIGAETMVVLTTAYRYNFDSSNTIIVNLDQLLIK